MGRGIATYTASWAAPNHGEVHSQQRFMCVGSKGEVRVDQGHRGYEGHYDGSYKSLNPLFMRYTPDEEGFFAGQRRSRFATSRPTAGSSEPNSLVHLPSVRAGKSPAATVS